MKAAVLGLLGVAGVGAALLASSRVQAQHAVPKDARLSTGKSGHKWAVSLAPEGTVAGVSNGFNVLDATTAEHALTYRQNISGPESGKRQVLAQGHDPRLVALALRDFITG